jgi:alcohol dehydrogenase
MQAHRYPQMLEIIRSGKLSPEKLVRKTITLKESLDELVNMNKFSGTGVTMINQF